MAVDKDQTAWLPEPPPPRPARRDAAIDAALRKFEGVDEGTLPAGQRPRPSWTRAHRTQLSMALSAFLLVLIGIPAAWIGVRQAPVPVAHETGCVGAACNSKPVAMPSRQAPPAAEVAQAPAAPVSANSRAPLRTNRGADADAAAANRQLAGVPAAAPPEAQPVAAAPPPPPPPPSPPPPPPPAASAERDSVQAGSQDLVVTGSRIREPNVSAFERAPRPQTGRTASGASAKAVAKDQPYAAFVRQLQAAVRANDRRAIIALIAFPLQVNGAHPRIYREAASVQRDFDRIFTPRVRRAILAQDPSQIFSRDQGGMVGD